MPFLKDSVRTFIVRFSLLTLNIVSGIINARWLGPVGIGTIAIFTLVQTVAFRFCNLGFGSGFAFFIARKKISTKEVLNLSLMISGAMSLISCIVLVSIWKEQFSPFRTLSPLFFYMSLVTIFPFFINSFMGRILSGHLDIKSLNFSEILRTAFYIPLLVIFVVVMKCGILGGLLAIIVPQLLVSFYLFWRVKVKYEDHVSVEESHDTMKQILKIWRYGRWSYLILYLNFFLQKLPFLLLVYWYSPAIAGFYSLAMGLFNKIRLLPDSFASILFPFTAASNENAAVNRTNTLCRTFSLALAGILLVMVFTANLLITTLFGDSFIHSVPVFYALAPAILLFPLSKFITVHIAAFGEPNKVFWLSLITLPAGVLVSYILIPRYGAVGAALSFSITYLVLTIICFYTYIRFTKTRFFEIIVPQKSDLLYLTILKNWFVRKK